MGHHALFACSLFNHRTYVTKLGGRSPFGESCNCEIPQLQLYFETPHPSPDYKYSRFFRSSAHEFDSGLRLLAFAYPILFFWELVSKNPRCTPVSWSPPFILFHVTSPASNFHTFLSLHPFFVLVKTSLSSSVRITYLFSSFTKPALNRSLRN